MNDYEISLTIGPKKELDNIISSHPDRQFKLFQPVREETEYLLIDCSGEKSIFHSGLDFSVYDTINPDIDANGYLECRYITLNRDNQKIFRSLLHAWRDDIQKRPSGLQSSVLLRSRKNNLEFLLINLWNNEDSFFVFDNSSAMINNFGRDGSKLPIIRLYKTLE